MVILLSTLLALGLQDKKEPDPSSTKEAMRRIQLLVGEWRVTGQNEEAQEDAWSEKHQWGFMIEKDVFSLQMSVTDGKALKEGLLSYDLKRKVYRLAVTRADGTAVTYEGPLKNREMALEQVVEKGAAVQERLVFQLLRDNRHLIARERRAGTSATWIFMQSFSCTKEGVPFVKNEGPKCVVTGGTGTIAVSHGGKSYTVCCSG